MYGIFVLPFEQRRRLECVTDAFSEVEPRHVGSAAEGRADAILGPCSPAAEMPEHEA